MDAISPARLAEIERRLGQAMAGRFGLDLSALVLDMTNFAGPVKLSALSHFRW
jgi:uncharacterized protein (DUF1697 family)